jgi:hypothetical protein
MYLKMNENYPPGTVGDLAVCYVHSSENMWSFERVATREDGDRELKKALGQSDVLEVIIEGGPKEGLKSAAVWIAKCEGGDQWLRIVETDGAEQYWKQWVGA